MAPEAGARIRATRTIWGPRDATGQDCRVHHGRRQRSHGRTTGTGCRRVRGQPRRPIASTDTWNVPAAVSKADATAQLPALAEEAIPTLRPADETADLSGTHEMPAMAGLTRSSRPRRSRCPPPRRRPPPACACRPRRRSSRSCEPRWPPPSAASWSSTNGHASPTPNAPWPWRVPRPRTPSCASSSAITWKSCKRRARDRARRAPISRSSRMNCSCVQTASRPSTRSWRCAPRNSPACAPCSPPTSNASSAWNRTSPTCARRWSDATSRSRR